MTKQVKIKVRGKSLTYEVGPDVDIEVEDVRDSEGRRIDQDYVDRAVADARAQTGRGRPSLTGGRAHSPHVSFRVPADVRAKAEAQAVREGRRVSDLARQALEEYLARQEAS